MAIICCFERISTGGGVNLSVSRYTTTQGDRRHQMVRSLSLRHFIYLQHKGSHT